MKEEAGKSQAATTDEKNKKKQASGAREVAENQVWGFLKRVTGEKCRRKGAGRRREGGAR